MVSEGIALLVSSGTAMYKSGRPPKTNKILKIRAFQSQSNQIDYSLNCSYHVYLVGLVTCSLFPQSFPLFLNMDYCYAILLALENTLTYEQNANKIRIVSVRDFIC